MWYSKVCDDIGVLPDFIEHYDAELERAKIDVKVSGRLEQSISMLPGITEHRFNQLQEIEAVLNFLNIKLREIRREKFKQYLERYQRELSSRDAEKYADGDNDVIEYELLINQVALVRNRFQGIIKALESKSYSLNNITRLRCAGLDEINLV